MYINPYTIREMFQKRQSFFSNPSRMGNSRWNTRGKIIFVPIFWPRIIDF